MSYIFCDVITGYIDPFTLNTERSTGVFVSIFISEEDKYHWPRAQTGEPWIHWGKTAINTALIIASTIFLFIPPHHCRSRCSANYPVRLLYGFKRALDGVSFLPCFSLKFRFKFYLRLQTCPDKARNLQTLQKKMIIEANRSQSSDYSQPGSLNLKPKANFPLP